MSTMSATELTYINLAKAYKFFNNSMFGGKLPDCLITFRHHKDSIGTFYGSRFYAMDGSKRLLDEVALNASWFTRGAKLTLSTLVHEMAHLWQHHFGKCGKGGYHNKQWGDKMEALGLMPSSTAAPGGKRTGVKVSHYVIAGGAFEKAFDRFMKENPDFALFWASREESPAPKKERKKRAKTVKYCCPQCELAARAPEGASIRCEECDELMVPPDEA